MFPKTVSDRPACHEERQAVKHALSRVEYCDRKSERVRNWMRVLPHEISEYKGRISKLKRLVEFEVPRAIGVLNNLLRRLEEYNAVRVGPAEKAYNDVTLVRELWPECTTNEATEISGPAGAEQEAIRPAEEESQSGRDGQAAVDSQSTATEE
jgi:hypothetical protein